MKSVHLTTTTSRKENLLRAEYHHLQSIFNISLPPKILGWFDDGCYLGWLVGRVVLPWRKNIWMRAGRCNQWESSCVVTFIQFVQPWHVQPLLLQLLPLHLNQ